MSEAKRDYTKILERARKRLAYVDDYDKDNRDNQTKDTEFVYVPGKQWDDDTRTKRTAWGDACLEFPQLKQFVNQVVNDQRQQRPGIRVHPASGDASVEVAATLQGLIRTIEYDSQAEAVYDCGYQNSVVGGRGYWRVGAEYEEGESFNQRVILSRIPDPNCVRLDPDFQTPDGADRNYGFVLERVHKDEFKERWPKADPLDYVTTGDFSLWYDGDHVIVADYYERVCTKRKLLALTNGTTGYADDLAKVFGAEVPKHLIKREREVDQYEIDWYTIAGGEQVLEEHEWPGTIIPIVCTMGDEVFVDGKRLYQGLITQAKSSQAMFNYGMTNQAIHLALTPRAPWVAEKRQIEGLESIWKDANNRNYSVLPYHAVVDDGVALPPPQRQPPSTPDSGWINWTQQMTMLMRSTVGMYESSLGMRAQETSGIAIRQKEQQGDTATFHYADNLSRAIALTGRIVVEVIPYYYDAQRIEYIVGDDDERKAVQLNEQLPDPMNPGRTQINPKTDLKRGKYAVTVSAGPTYQTKRQETAEMLIEAGKAYPPLWQAAGDVIIKSQDMPEADKLAKRLRAIAPPPVQAMIAAEDAGQDPRLAAVSQQLQEVQQQAEQMQAQMAQQMQQLAMENEQLKADKSAQVAIAQAKASEAQSKAANDHERAEADRAFDSEKLAIERDKVWVDAIKVLVPLIQAQMAPAIPAVGQVATETLEKNP